MIARLAVLCALLSSTAFAQWSNVPPGTPNAKPAPQPVPPQRMRPYVERGDDFRLTWMQDPSGNTGLSVLEPEGFRVQIFERDQLWASDELPAMFQLRPNTRYRIVLIAPDGSTWVKRIESRGGMHASLRVIGPGPGPIVVNPPPPPPQPIPVVQPPMNDGQFASLMRALNAESFANDRLNVLRSAAQGSHFTVAQVGTVIDAFDFSKDKLEAVRITRSGIVDRQNAYQLSSRFAFSADKKALQTLLAE